MLALLILFFVLFARAHDIIPGRMIDTRGGGGAVLELHLRMGTPPRDVRLAADFSRDEVLLMQSPLDKSFSATLLPVGYADMFHLGRKHIMLPIGVDPQAVSTLCPTCDGLLGLGGNSPIWTIWRKVRTSVSGLRLEEEGLSTGARCLQPDPLFCNTTGKVLGKEVRIIFGPHEPVTRLPISIFRELRGGRSLRQPWPDLDIVLDGDGPHEARTIHILGRQIVRDTTGEPEFLTVRQQNTNESIVVIGYEALRSAAWHRDFNSGLLVVDPRISERNLTLLQALSLVILWPIFFYWKLVKPIFRLSSLFAIQHPGMVIVHTVMDVLTIFLPYLFFFQRGTFNALRGDLFLFIVLGCVSIASSAWLIFSVLNMFLRGSEYHGLFGNDFGDRRNSLIDDAQPLDGRKSLRVARSMIVHQWARDILILTTIWLILLAVSPDTLRGLCYVVVYVFIFCISVGAPLSALRFSTAQPSVLWMAWIISSAVCAAAYITLGSIRIVIPLAELTRNYLEIIPGLFIASSYLVLCFFVLQWEQGHAKTLKIWIRQTTRSKIE